MTSDWMGVFALLIFICLPFLIFSHVTRTRHASTERMEREAAQLHMLDLGIATTRQRLEAVRAWQAGKTIIDIQDERKSRLVPIDFLTEQADRLIWRGELGAAREVLEARLPLDRKQDQSWRDMEDLQDDPHVLQISYERLAQLLRLEFLVRDIDTALAYLSGDLERLDYSEVDIRPDLEAELAEVTTLCDRLKAQPLAERMRALCRSGYGRGGRRAVTSCPAPV